MKEYLMIGGPRDGQLVTFTGEPPSYVNMPMPGDGGFGVVEYRRETLIGSTQKKFFVYVTGDGDLIERLIAGYGAANHEQREI